MSIKRIGEQRTMGDLDRVLADVAAGKPVIVVDHEDRENEGDLVVAAAHATEETIGLMIRYGSGVVCAPMPGEDLDRLDLPPMVAVNEDPKTTAYTVSVDRRVGVTTGISAADRAATVRALADPRTVPTDLQRPGHVFPLRAVRGGVLCRPGHTEAAVDLCRLAGVPPVGVICELVNDDGSVMRLPELVRFAESRGFAMLTIADLIRHRVRAEMLAERVADTTLPTDMGRFRMLGYRSTLVPEVEAVALVMGEVDQGGPALVRVHSECLTGDAFSSDRCDCGAQLRAAMSRVAAEERGVVVYLRGHEGRGIGLMNKLAAYQLQDQGFDTVSANRALGLPVDARDYRIAGWILRDLGVSGVRLLTNNPRKKEALDEFGFDEVTRVPLECAATPDSHAYLGAKRDLLGHHLTVSAIPGTVGIDRRIS